MENRAVKPIAIKRSAEPLTVWRDVRTSIAAACELQQRRRQKPRRPVRLNDRGEIEFVEVGILLAVCGLINLYL